MHSPGHRGAEIRSGLLWGLHRASSAAVQPGGFCLTECVRLYLISTWLERKQMSGAATVHGPFVFWCCFALRQTLAQVLTTLKEASFLGSKQDVSSSSSA